jgi:hypothetical protein
MKEYRAEKIREIESAKKPKVFGTAPDPVTMANYLSEFYKSNAYKGD